MKLARDLMTTELWTVSPDLPLTELDELLASRASGAPVLSGKRLVGVVSRTDVVRALSRQTEVAEEVVAGFHRETQAEGVAGGRILPHEQELIAQGLAALTVADVMSTRLITVRPDETAQRVAQQMLRYRIHRILVTNGDQLLGIVSSLDLAQLIAEPEHVRSPQPATGPEPTIYFTPDLEGHRNDLLPGDARIATLRADPGNGASTLLVRLPPGGRIEAHRHVGPVQHFVLSGAYQCDGQTFRAGTYHLLPERDVPPMTSTGGAVVLVVHDPAA